jgi:4-phytase / acid phosphatase
MWKPLALVLLLLAVSGTPIASAAPTDQSRLLMVVVMSRHGVRSPTHPSELNAYAAQPWPTWSGIKPGYLTPHGATLMKQFGEAYRRWYGAALGFGTGCPAAGSVYIWADVDERTKDTGAAIAHGFAPGCNIGVGHAPADPDPLFDPLPGVGTVSKTASTASVLGAVGGNLDAITQAYGAAFTTMERVVGCTTAAHCKQISAVPTTIANDGDGGLAGINGGLDMAGDVAENLLLEYVDGHPNVGWGRVNHATLIQLLQLHQIGKELEHNRYAARAHSSNIMAQIQRGLEQGATGKPVAGAKFPAGARFVFLSGHDTQLAELSTMFGLGWLVKGDQRNDTPPGGALVFELHQGGGEPFVRTYYAVQTLDAMRAVHGENPERVPVYVPGCPGYDCPFSTFSAVVAAAIDPNFVAR